VRAAESAEVERASRQPLARSRHEVVTLTASVDVLAEPKPPSAAGPRWLRVAAYRWVVIGAGAIGAGLLEAAVTALERIVHPPDVPRGRSARAPMGVVPATTRRVPALVTQLDAYRGKTPGTTRGSGWAEVGRGVK